MNELPTISPLTDRFAPDGPYALIRLALSVAVATMVNAGMWAIIVVLPQAQAAFGVDRASATLPYTLMMFGLAFGTIVLGRLSDRTGIAAPLAIGGVLLGAGFVVAGFAPKSRDLFSAHALLIGVGTGAGFGAADGGYFPLVRAAARALPSSSSRPATISPARFGR